MRVGSALMITGLYSDLALERSGAKARSWARAQLRLATIDEDKISGK
jgi:hypothetical protein